MDRRCSLVLISLVLTTGVASSCKGFGPTGDLRLDDGSGGATSTTRATTGTGDASGSETGSAVTTSTSAPTTTSTSMSTSTGTTAAGCQVVTHCSESFDDDSYEPCISDNNETTYGTLVTPSAGTITLRPAAQTGFWYQSSLGARFIYAQVGTDPFAAVTFVRAFDTAPGVEPGMDSSLAGLALRRHDAPIGGADNYFWMKNEAGKTFQDEIGIRVAYGRDGQYPDLQDVDNLVSEVVSDGIALGICRYSDNDTLHAFYRRAPQEPWLEITFDTAVTYSEIGPVDIGIVTASFSMEAPEVRGEFAALAVDTCVTLDAATCTAQLELMSQGMSF